MLTHNLLSSATTQRAGDPFQFVTDLPNINGKEFGLTFGETQELRLSRQSVEGVGVEAQSFYELPRFPFLLVWSSHSARPYRCASHRAYTTFAYWSG